MPVSFRTDSMVRGKPKHKTTVLSKPMRKKAAAALVLDTPHVWIDDRAGSKELVRYTPLDSCGELCRLDSADVMLMGNGPDSTVLSVGVEVKSILDLIASINTGRLQATQIPNMIEQYDVSWLLHYGLYRCGNDGALELYRGGGWQPWVVGSRAVPYGYIEHLLMTLQALDIRIKRVADVKEAAQWIGSLARWFAKPWHEHRGMRTFDKSRSSALLLTLDVETRMRAEMFACLPGIGFERGVELAKHFTLRRLMNASDAELAKVPGIGKVLASVIRQALE